MQQGEMKADTMVYEISVAGWKSSITATVCNCPINTKAEFQLWKLLWVRVSHGGWHSGVTWCYQVAPKSMGKFL